MLRKDGQQTEVLKPVFVDLSVHASDRSKAGRRIRVAKVSSQNDISLLVNSLRHKHPIVADCTEFGSDGRDVKKEVKAVAAEFGATSYEVAPSVWLLSPSDVLVERVRSR